MVSSGLKIVFEDDQILVVDKPAGLVVNRSVTVKERTLQDLIADHLKLGRDLGIGERAGIVHRLDRETSGLLVCAKTERAFEKLQAQFKSRLVKKEYVALVHGKTASLGSIEGALARIGSFGKFGITAGGKEARTDFTSLKHYELKGEIFSNLVEGLNKNRSAYLKSHATGYSLLSVYPATGRTHQIRVHLKSIGHPVVSDLIYAPRKLLKFDLLWCPRLFLHAKKIELTHPTGGKRLRFESDLPNDLKDAMLNLTSND